MAKKTFVLPALADFFSTYLPKTRGLSENTSRSYRHAFKLLLLYVYGRRRVPFEKIEFTHLENGMVVEWLNSLEEKRECSTITRNQRLAAIASFAKFALRNNFDGALSFCAEVERIPKKKTCKRAPAAYMTREEIAVLLRLPDLGRKNGRRDRTILSTLYATGARAQELCDIRVCDVRFADPVTVALKGKGEKTRVVVIPEQCAALLKRHIECEGAHNSAQDSRCHVFSSQTHEHMTISCLEAIVKKYIEMAKTLRTDLFRNNYTPHSFRHTIAMHMLDSGIPLPVIKTFLGHASIATTMVYVAADFELVSKYLKDKDPYAAQEIESTQEQGIVLPAFLR
ncbi:MAG: site-specific integrase [Synergistaceae bacterium]|nr:site-specific integrase [Synergistaceae bacterium]